MEVGLGHLQRGEGLLLAEVAQEAEDQAGFYFAPSYGYYSVPRHYWGQRWYEGQYLPSIFWRYQVNDWAWYGLEYPPPGTIYVYVDNNIYLIDQFDGYIIDVINDVWRW